MQREKIEIEIEKDRLDVFLPVPACPCSFSSLYWIHYDAGWGKMGEVWEEEKRPPSASPFSPPHAQARKACPGEGIILEGRHGQMPQARQGKD